jgi:hypothetical protein
VRASIFALPCCRIAKEAMWDSMMNDHETRRLLEVVLVDDGQKTVSLEVHFKLIFHIMFYLISTQYFVGLPKIKALALAAENPELRFIMSDEVYAFFHDHPLFSKKFHRRPEYFKATLLDSIWAMGSPDDTLKQRLKLRWLTPQLLGVLKVIFIY